MALQGEDGWMGIKKTCRGAAVQAGQQRPFAAASTALQQLQIGQCGSVQAQGPGVSRKGYHLRITVYA